MSMRMQHAAPVWMLAALAAVGAGATQAATATTDSDAKARSEITQLETRWLAAVAPGGDRQDLQTILADDFIDINWQGRVRHKADLIGAPTQAHVTQHVTDLHIRAWQDTAVATGINQVHSTDKGWRTKVSFTDVFVRFDGHWRAVSAQETARKPSKS